MMLYYCIIEVKKIDSGLHFMEVNFEAHECEVKYFNTMNFSISLLRIQRLGGLVHIYIRLVPLAV